MFLRMNEKIDEIGFGDLKLIQSEDGFRYGVDAVLLADFAASIISGTQAGRLEEISGRISVSGIRIFDLGTGSGVIPLILSHKVPDSRITGVELQEESVERARRTVALNGLESRIDILHRDVKDMRKGYRAVSHIVVSNPPYMERGSGLINEDSAKMIARHETTAGLKDFFIAASHLLDKKGHFFMVHRPYRLADIFCFARETGFEAKTMRLVAPCEDREPNIVLMHFIKGAGKQLKVMKQLNVHDVNGLYTEEIDRIYERI